MKLGPQTFTQHEYVDGVLLLKFGCRHIELEYHGRPRLVHRSSRFRVSVDSDSQRASTVCRGDMQNVHQMERCCNKIVSCKSPMVNWRRPTVWLTNVQRFWSISTSKLTVCSEGTGCWIFSSPTTTVTGVTTSALHLAPTSGAKQSRQ